jgi:hypothetical protein
LPNQHVVAAGECVSRIAHSYGFRDYRTIYEDGSNAEFRKKRPNPNLIYPGDEIVIPDKKPRKVSKPTGARHKFVVNTTTRYLRMRLHYDDGAPIANTPFKLTSCGQVVQGQTDSNGILEQEIPKDSETAQVDVESFTWKVRIANLNPMEKTSDDGVSGYQSRLRNLDYPPLKVDGICGPKTQAKLKEVHGS